MIILSPADLALASALIMAAAGLSLALGLRAGRRLLVASARMVVQLLAVGLVLKTVFEAATPYLIGLIALVMLAVAGYETTARQSRPLRGGWSYAIGTVSMCVSCAVISVLTLVVVLQPTPWYAPQYAIPLLGMLLGNTMNGVAIGLDRLTQGASEQRAVIDTRLALGQGWRETIGELRTGAILSGMIPTINGMAAAGIVSLPGMMTGQILAGSPPLEAVKYQILIMFLIGAGTTFGTVTAVWLGARRLFDDRERLRLDRLKSGG